MASKDDFIEALRSTEREGVEDLIDWLESSDFFEAPSSTKYHGSYPGGLCDHSLNVMDSIIMLNKQLETNIKEDSMILVALLHDLCKANYYILDEEEATGPQIKYMNDLLSKSDIGSILKKHQTKGYVSKVINALKNGEDVPPFSYTYKVKDELPMGHGEKSLYIIQKHIQLTDAEALAIRWHLGGYDPGFHFGFPSGFAAKQAVKENALVSLLISADFLSTWIVENEDLK